MTTVVGIDPSLTNTGIARVQHDEVWSTRTWSCPTKGRRDETLPERNDRQIYIASQLAPFWDGADLVVIEAPSHGSKGGSMWDRAGLWWRIMARLLAGAVPVVQVAPMTRAKWATGSGRSDKAAVGAAIARMWPAAQLANSDQADALVLASIGIHLLGIDAPFPTTEYRKAAIEGAKLKLPEGTAA